MHAIAFNAIRSAQRTISRRECRIVAGSRCPLPRRNFHRSAVAYRIPDPLPAANDLENTSTDTSENEPCESNVEEEGMAADNPGDAEDASVQVRTRDGRATLRRTRATRPRQPEGVPPFPIPDWFYEKNVKCIEDSQALGGSLAVYGESFIKEIDETEDSKVATELERQAAIILDANLSAAVDAKYAIHVDVYTEIMATLRAGLALRPPKSSQPIPRPITLLQCPRDGGAYYLDSVVETVASKLGADLIRVDAQDLAQLLGQYLDENLAWNYAKTSLVGYNAAMEAGKLEEYDNEGSQQGEVEDAEEDGMLGGLGKLFGSNKPTKKALNSLKRLRARGPTPLISFTIARGAPGLFQNPNIFAPSNGQDNHFTDFNNRDSAQGKPATTGGLPDTWDSLKIATAFESLIAAADSKRARTSDGNEQSDTAPSNDTSRNIIIQIRDYKELSRLGEGQELLTRLRDAVNKKWKSGVNIILVGTTSSEEGEPALSKGDIQHLQSDIVDGEKRTIFVPTDRKEEREIIIENDEKARIRQINIRHVSDMILKLAEGTQHLSPAVVDLEKDLDSAVVFSEGLEEAVWTYAKVHRIATTILGLENTLVAVDGPIFSKALKFLSASDEAKFDWGEKELKEEDAEVEEVVTTTQMSHKDAEHKLKSIRKKANSHEKKLLSGFVLPSDIRTTFADVRAPKETIEALKTLTSLSLIRPEAFSYGVLATDKIPGLLLYGPPGTGKTLLAKAVARESGAAMLEVTAADLNDMFVGEGEKNVRAVFSLAKKLSPCVVFIDEADALLSARGDNSRKAHRELINQFLREWDGMNDMSAFIMVATNRPFDLDEAVLRRLPRRLLVDLPVEKDREAILKIHLKDELLDESVDLSQLSKDTPFYSGSDLKNLSVAAALACIREENEAATKYTGDKPYVYPEKRILTKAHFDKAMEEISASISEDMSTLSAIRKFDEKYGDRKGRRKKAAAMGFGGTTIVEKDSEAARVRKSKVEA